LRKGTQVRWDIGAARRVDDGADESTSPQVDITALRPISAEFPTHLPFRQRLRLVDNENLCAAIRVHIVTPNFWKLRTGRPPRRHQDCRYATENFCWYRRWHRLSCPEKVYRLISRLSALCESGQGPAKPFEARIWELVTNTTLEHIAFRRGQL
jgi:hypothetical protein